VGERFVHTSQCARRLGRPTVPLLLPAVTWAGSAFRTLGMTDFSPEQIRLLTHGRVVATDQMRDTLGFTRHRRPWSRGIPYTRNVTTVPDHPEHSAPS
jgi:hypothetical protein